MQMNTMESAESFPVLMIWDRYVGNFSIIQNMTYESYSESLLRNILDANVETKNTLVDERKVSLKIWFIPGAGHLITSYNKKVPSTTLQQILDFLDKFKVFVLFFDAQHPNYEYLERLFQTLEKKYSTSNYIAIAIKSSPQDFKDYNIIDGFKAKYPHLKEFIPNFQKTDESLDQLYNIVGKLILEDLKS